MKGLTSPFTSSFLLGLILCSFLSGGRSLGAANSMVKPHYRFMSMAAGDTGTALPYGTWSLFENPAFLAVKVGHHQHRTFYRQEADQAGRHVLSQRDHFNGRQLNGEDIRELEELVGQDLYLSAALGHVSLAGDIGIGAILNSTYNSAIHGHSYPLLDLSLISDAALLVGRGVTFQDGTFGLGATLRPMHRLEFIRHADVVAIVSDKDYFRLRKQLAEGDALGVDLGSFAKIDQRGSTSYVTCVVKDAGDTSFFPSKGFANPSPQSVPERIRQTVDFGLGQVRSIAGQPGPLTLAYVYHDILQPNSVGAGHRLGMTYEPVSWLRAAVGVYQESLTSGLQTRIGPMSLGYATYAETTSPAPARQVDRRHLLELDLLL